MSHRPPNQHVPFLSLRTMERVISLRIFANYAFISNAFIFTTITLIIFVGDRIFFIKKGHGARCASAIVNSFRFGYLPKRPTFNYLRRSQESFIEVKSVFEFWFLYCIFYKLFCKKFERGKKFVQSGAIHRRDIKLINSGIVIRNQL